MKIETITFNFHDYPMMRSEFYKAIDQGFKINPIVAILGPRQCGKTTLARDYSGFSKEPSLGKDVKGKVYLGRENYFDLESFVD